MEKVLCARYRADQNYNLWCAIDEKRTNGKDTNVRTLCRHSIVLPLEINEIDIQEITCGICVRKILKNKNANKNKTKVVTTEGTSIEEDHWTVTCPNCQKEYEFTGYFDSGEPIKCDCGVLIKVTRIVFSNGEYIE